MSSYNSLLDITFFLKIKNYMIHLKLSLVFSLRNIVLCGRNNHFTNNKIMFTISSETVYLLAKKNASRITFEYG